MASSRKRDFRNNYMIIIIQKGLRKWHYSDIHAYDVEIHGHHEYKTRNSAQNANHHTGINRERRR